MIQIEECFLIGFLQLVDFRIIGIGNVIVEESRKCYPQYSLSMQIYMYFIKYKKIFYLYFAKYTFYLIVLLPFVCITFPDFP